MFKIRSATAPTSGGRTTSWGGIEGVRVHEIIAALRAGSFQQSKTVHLPAAWSLRSRRRMRSVPPFPTTPNGDQGCARDSCEPREPVDFVG